VTGTVATPGPAGGVEVIGGTDHGTHGGTTLTLPATSSATGTLPQANEQDDRTSLLLGGALLAISLLGWGWLTKRRQAK